MNTSKSGKSGAAYSTDSGWEVGIEWFYAGKTERINTRQVGLKREHMFNMGLIGVQQSPNHRLSITADATRSRDDWGFIILQKSR